MFFMYVCLHKLDKKKWKKVPTHMRMDGENALEALHTYSLTHCVSRCPISREYEKKHESTTTLERKFHFIFFLFFAY